MGSTLPAPIRFLTLAWLIGGSGFAVAAMPAWEKDLTRAPAGPHRAVPLCDITFDIGWNRLISAGRVNMDIKQAGRFWRAHATGGTTGVARRLWRYDLEMTSYADQSTTHSRYTQLRETDSEETCRYRVVFEPQRVITETTVAPHKGATTTGTTILPYGPVDDLLGVILYVRSLPLTPGQKITRVVQPWDRPYVATFEVLGRQSLNYGGRKTPCIKLGVEVRKIDRNTLTMTTYGKVKKATIWLSDDELRLPIEMRAEIWIGYISVNMVSAKMLSGKEAIAPGPSAANMIVKPDKR